MLRFDQFGRIERGGREVLAATLVKLIHGGSTISRPRKSLQGYSLRDLFVLLATCETQCGPLADLESLCRGYSLRENERVYRGENSKNGYSLRETERVY